MENEVRDGLQEDGTFLVFAKDDKKSVDKSISDDDDGKTNVDLSFLPEEHRSSVENLIGLLNEKFSAQLDTLRNKAEFADLLAKRSNASDDGRSKNTTEGENQKKGLFDDVKFEENDYYSKFFKTTFNAVQQLNDQISEIRSAIVGEKVSTRENDMRKFFKDNKVPAAVVQKMDELATELGGGNNPNVYSVGNLKRLLTMAKMELGMSDTRQNRVEEDVDGDGGSRNTPRKKSTVFEFSSNRKSFAEKKKINTMKEAWEKAEEDLATEK